MHDQTRAIVEMNLFKYLTRYSKRWMIQKIWKKEWKHREMPPFEEDPPALFKPIVIPLLLLMSRKKHFGLVIFTLPQCVSSSYSIVCDQSQMHVRDVGAVDLFFSPFLGFMFHSIAVGVGGGSRPLGAAWTD